MNVKLYAGDTLAYDNLLPEEEGYNIFSLAIEETVNKGGVATILMPRDHPVSNEFSSYNVPVTVYRDGKLRWRGRPIPPAKEDVFGRKTITCEGELCFLQDAIHRPHSYSGTAADIFSQIISVYNAAVEPWKRFVVGAVTVDGSVEVTIKEPESALKTVQKIVDQCGGYIFFDSAVDGSRRINWYKDFPYSCNQTVRYGENLIDCKCQPAASDFATRIIPYGAVGEDGNRIKINVAGKDYVENIEAVAIHGIIEKAVVYSDVSDPAALQARAESDVAVSGLLPSVIRLETIDMSRQDLTLDAFAVGQQVPAESVAHGLSGAYHLTSLSEDLVNPQAGGITLQREQASVSGGAARTLTGAIVASSNGMLSSAKNSAELSAAGAVANQTQEYIFNKLTNNGALRGLYMLDGQLYINASYLRTGVISSEDGAIQIDLSGGATEPVFNTGISTNGISVRGDTVGAETMFKVWADYLIANGKEVPTIAVAIHSADGCGIGAISEVFNSSFEPTGLQFRLFNHDQDRCVNIIAAEKVAGISVQNSVSGGAVGQIALDADGAFALWGLSKLNNKTISWKSNGDGTFTLIGQ